MNCILMQRAMDARCYLEADGSIVTINVKESMMNINILKTTDKYIQAFNTIELASDLPSDSE